MSCKASDRQENHEKLGQPPGGLGTVAVAAAAIAFVEEPLVVPLQLVVEDDAADAPASVADARLSALVGAVDLDVVGQLTGLPEAGVERLAGFVGPLVAWGRAIGFE